MCAKENANFKSDMQNCKDLNAPALQSARGAKTTIFFFYLILTPKLDSYSLAPQVENCSTLRSNDAVQTVSFLLFFKKLALVPFIEKSNKVTALHRTGHGGGFL